MGKYRIIIKKRFGWFKKKVDVYVKTDNLEEVADMFVEQLNNPYLTLVTAKSKIYVIDTYDIEEIEVLPL